MNLYGVGNTLSTICGVESTSFHAFTHKIYEFWNEKVKNKTKNYRTHIKSTFLIDDLSWSGFMPELYLDILCGTPRDPPRPLAPTAELSRR